MTKNKKRSARQTSMVPQWLPPEFVQPPPWPQTLNSRLATTRGLLHAAAGPRPLLAALGGHPSVGNETHAMQSRGVHETELCRVPWQISCCARWPCAALTLKDTVFRKAQHDKKSPQVLASRIRIRLGCSQGHIPPATIASRAAVSFVTTYPNFHDRLSRLHTSCKMPRDAHA